MAKKKVKPFTTEETLYALRHIKSGKLLRMERSSNYGGDCCGEYTVTLDHEYYDSGEFDEDVWYIDSPTNAEYVRNFSTPWFNSSERCPKHDYEPEELEVVEIHRIVTTKPKVVKIPTVKEYFEFKYKEKEPRHYEYIMKEIEEDTYNVKKIGYSLYELLILMDDGLWRPEEEKSKNE